MPEIVDLQAKRLEGLRVREQALKDTHERFVAVVDETRPTLDRYWLALRVALDARADGLPVGDRDPQLESEGAVATDQVAAVEAQLRGARIALRDEIATLVRNDHFHVGDQVFSVSRKQLTVAQIFRPEQDLSLIEVTLTGDGGPMERRQHDFALDSATGRPLDDGVEQVRFERWWGAGLRAGGWLHATSRRVIDTD